MTMKSPKVEIPFIKMHGLGNDFVIIDQRKRGYKFEVACIMNRRLGIGGDQLVTIENSDTADCGMKIYNADGSACGGCGNATRCVAFLIMGELNKDEITISVELENRILKCWKVGDRIVKVDMGKPLLNWVQIPLAKPCDTTNLPFSNGQLSGPAAVSMGSPHVVFFVADINAIDLTKIGPIIEHDPLFPQRVNVNIAQIGNGRIKLKVWERGVGPTLACGTGACSTLVSAIRKNLIHGNSSTISLPGGDLYLEWNGGVIMTGPVQNVFSGSILI